MKQVDWASCRHSFDSTSKHCWARTRAGHDIETASSKCCVTHGAPESPPPSPPSPSPSLFGVGLSAAATRLAATTTLDSQTGPCLVQRRRRPLPTDRLRWRSSKWRQRVIDRDKAQPCLSAAAHCSYCAGQSVLDTLPLPRKGSVPCRTRLEFERVSLTSSLLLLIDRNTECLDTKWLVVGFATNNPSVVRILHLAGCIGRTRRVGKAVALSPQTVSLSSSLSWDAFHQRTLRYHTRHQSLHSCRSACYRIGSDHRWVARIYCRLFCLPACSAAVAMCNK